MNTVISGFDTATLNVLTQNNLNMENYSNSKDRREVIMNWLKSLQESQRQANFQIAPELYKYWLTFGPKHTIKMPDATIKNSSEQRKAILNWVNTDPEAKTLINDEQYYVLLRSEYYGQKIINNDTLKVLIQNT